MIRTDKYIVLIKALLIMTLLFLMACSAQPILRLEAVDDHAIMYQGMEYVESDRSNSTVIIAFYRHIGDKLVMDVEVINHSDSLLHVDVSNFYYRAFEHSDSGEKKPMRFVRAVDPEDKLLEIDLEYSKVIAREQRKGIVGGVTSTFTLIADLAQSEDDLSEEEQMRRQYLRMERAIQRTVRRDEFYRRISRLNGKRHHWEISVLRNTDLMPEESVAGEVVLPAEPGADLIEITIAVADEEHSFRYLQQSYKP